MEESPYNNPLRLRFSLREVLLAMVAICALAALYAGKLNTSPTPFFTTFDEQALLRRIYEEQQLGFFARQASSGRGSSDRGGSFESLTTIKAPTTDVFRSRVMPQLHDEIESELDAAGCEITGRGMRFVNKSGELLGFAFRYSRGDTRGVFRAHTVEVEDDRTRLLVFVDEF